MQIRSWRPRKRLVVAAAASIILLIAVVHLRYRPVGSLAILRLPSYIGNDAAGKEIAAAQIGNATLPTYIKAILDPKDKAFDRLQCPVPTHGRYDYLRVDRGSEKAADSKIRYFFALNLRQCVGKLPRLMGSVVEAVRFLGPENCALSIVEGNSDDGTLEVLEALRTELESLGLEYHFQHSDIDPKHGNRIDALARLRNLALEPLVANSSQYSPYTTILFINDVAICMEDMLELVHQRVFQKADMTCAMDWNDLEVAPIFYDIWIARAINGDTFWEIPPDGGWRFASNLFWNHPVSRRRFDEHKAFQVFACWNGAVAFTAKPIMERTVSFRKSKPGECFSGEPRLLCKDFWIHGYSRIAVVPSVNLEYSDKSTKRVKALHGYVSDAVKKEGAHDESLRISWEDKPPEQVKCMADFADQSWAPWNQGFEPESSQESQKAEPESGA